MTIYVPKIHEVTLLNPAIDPSLHGLTKLIQAGM